MSDRSEKLFETLEPPRGGLAGLRARVERDGRRRLRVRRVRVVVVAMLVVALAGWAALAPRGTTEPLPAEFDFARMSLGLIPRPTEALTLPEDKRGEVAVHRVPLPTDEVVFYLVGSVHPHESNGG